MEVREVLEEVRRAVGLEGAFEDVRDEGVQVRLWHAVFQVTVRDFFRT